jgi:hypothetical protein
LQVSTISVSFAFMKVEINNLMTIKNFALQNGVTPSYIYKLIKEGKMSSFEIDGVQFIQVDKFPSIPVVNRR